MENKEKNTTLLSLDTSSSKTGWAIFKNGEYMDSGVIDLSKKELKKMYAGNSDKRIRDMCVLIYKILNKYNPDIVLVEKLNVSRNMNATRILSKIIGSIYFYVIHKNVIDKSNVFYYEMQASQWRKQIGIQKTGRKRDEYKMLSMQYVKDNFGISVSDDQSDAICMGIGYIKEFS